MTHVCPNCETENPPDEVVCPSCGLTLPAIAVNAEATRPEISLASVEGRALRAAIEDQHTPEQPPTSVEEPSSPLSATLPRRDDRRSDESIPAPQVADGIPAGSPVLKIGYARDNDLVIPLPQVSAHHAELAKAAGRYIIRDLGSTNGTSVNSHKVQTAYVVPGDTIALGSYEFAFTNEIATRLASSESMERETRAMEIPSTLRKPVVIGREVDCDIVLDGPQISRRHAELLFTGAGWQVRDLGSANGTYVNERANPIDTAVVTATDVLFFGSYRFPVSRISDFLDAGPEDITGGVVPLPTEKPVVTIGRGADNDVVIDAPQISRHHARLVRSNDALLIEDLGSANGTFIDGVKISQPTPLDPSKTISFGSYAVRLDLARGHIQRSYRGDILLQAENLRVEVPANPAPKRILDGVSFTAYPTEFIGLLGPSGAGKTTLLTALIGGLKPTYGRTLLNGDDLAKNYDRYRGAIGYVPQDDIMHSELTVFEALYYTAKLRLPPDTTDLEIERRIGGVLADLEISETRDVRIGTPDRKGISGGERKRVNLALELLTEPSFLCLDEPTSGLASEDALNVMRLLRRLADGGRTVLLTVHQPSLQAYRLMDVVLYLADGEEVYYGPAYPDSILYFHSDVRPNTPEAESVLADPGSCMKPIMSAKRAGEPMETLAARFRQSRYHEEYVEERRKNRTGVRVTASGERRAPRFSFRQWFTLCRRYFAVRTKDRVGMAVLMVQAPLIALLLDLVFASQGEGVESRLQYMPYALFLLVVSAIWFGCSNAAREIVSERAIYKRERMVNLSIGAYVLSKVAVLGGLALIQCVMLLAGTYFVLDFWGSPVFHLAILWTSALAGTAMGLLLSAIVRTSEAAMATVPLLLIPQIILGGAIMPLDEMSAPVAAVSYATVSRWGFEGVLQSEHLADAYEISAADLPKPPLPHLPAPPPPPNPLDVFFGEYETWLGVDVGVLAGFSLVLVFAVAGALRLREGTR